MNIYHCRVDILMAGELLNVLEPDALLSKDREGRMSKGMRAQGLILPRDLRPLDMLFYYVLDGLDGKGLVEPVPAYHQVMLSPVEDEGKENRQVSGNLDCSRPSLPLSRRQRPAVSDRSE